MLFYISLPKNVRIDSPLFFVRVVLQLCNLTFVITMALASQDDSRHLDNMKKKTHKNFFHNY